SLPVPLSLYRHLRTPPPFPSTTRFRSKIMLMAVMLYGLLEQTQAQQKMKLVYDKPAADWNEALPIGNSRLGAMVFGNPSREQIRSEEHTSELQSREHLVCRRLLEKTKE